MWTQIKSNSQINLSIVDSLWKPLHLVFPNILPTYASKRWEFK